MKNLLLSVIGLLFSFYLIGMIFSGTDTVKAEEEEDFEANAWIISKDFVKERLKSPSTADFPYLDYESTDLGNHRYRVRSYVDAQNSFGAIIRTNYIVTLKFNGGDWADQGNWVLEDIQTQ